MPSRAQNQHASDPSRQQANLPRFGFNFVNDRDYCSDHGSDVGSHVSPLDCTHFSEAYMEGKLGIVLPLKSSLCDCKRYLIFAIAGAFNEMDREPLGSVHGVGDAGSDPLHHGIDEFVFRGVTQIIDCDQEFTPTVVRFVGSKEVFNLLGKPFASAVDPTFEIRGRFT
ncbi:MAG: hypothetical protein ACRD3F_08630, partial [Acidobacteriaceae bacterium]